jgi:hypothetical protein
MAAAASPGAVAPALQHALRSAPSQEAPVPGDHAAHAANSPASAISASISMGRSLGLVA